MDKGKNKVFIIGTGAIGSALAVFLKKAGKEVVLLRGQLSEQTPAEKTIVVQLNNGATIRADVVVSGIGNYNTLDGVIVVATKSYGNVQVAERLKEKVVQSPIVVMQNGLDVEEPFLRQSFPEIYRCVLFASCQYTETGLRFKPASDSPIGVVRGGAASLATVINALQNSDFPFIAEADIQPIIWTKAIINCVFNTVCPLLEVDNGIFHRNKEALNVAQAVIKECLAVAAAESIRLDAEKVTERLLLISKTSDGQLISTYNDILHKRRTEIETLNLAIAKRADQLNQGALVTMTRLLGELVYIKSEFMLDKSVSQI